MEVFLNHKQVYIPGRKTPIYNIININNEHIGNIQWYGPWRKYCFYPNENTIWDNKCLINIQNKLNELNLARYKK